jgi:exopolyphosphatase/guanosine-5'-triphosphate,3'-diphosphate pyrophosphatase
VSAAVPVAAVDCGTNSTRLLVAAPDGSTLERRMTITRLGQGVDQTGLLADEAVERTVATLREYRRVMDAHRVRAVRVTATSAARDAANRDRFFAAAADAVGVPPELLDGEEEARLSYRGAVRDLDACPAPWLVADIGGGSTELAIGTDPAEPSDAVSLDVGCVRVTERFLHHDPPLADELVAARAATAAQLRAATCAHPALAGAATVVGLAGTVAAAVALELRLERYDRSAVHHRRLAASSVAALLDELSRLDEPGRRARPGMEAARAGVIVGGLVVLDELLGHLGADACLASESDILDGLVMSLLA